MYYRYGGRGIVVCKEWEDDYMSFYNWAISNGYKKNLTIDRINNDLGYEPDNCRWITLKENILRNAKLSDLDKKDIIRHYQEKVKRVKEIALMFKIDESRIYQILKENNIKRNRYV